MAIDGLVGNGLPRLDGMAVTEILALLQVGEALSTSRRESKKQTRGSLSREKAEEGEMEGKEGRGVQSIPQIRGTITEPNRRRAGVWFVKESLHW